MSIIKLTIFSQFSPVFIIVLHKKHTKKVLIFRFSQKIRTLTEYLLYYFVNLVIPAYIIPELFHQGAWIPVFQHSHIYVTTVVKILDI